MVDDIRIGDERFPVGLKRVEPKVEKLYYKGKWEEEWFEKTVAIVGSRRMTNYGKRVIERMVPVLIEAGVTVVSGMMYGVDQEAHKACLESSGRTIAVLGYGVDYEVSGEDKVLYKKIVQKGMILSEYQGEIAPQSWTFPERNRIVAGLAKGVIVIEGARRSGSMITANLAIDFGRKLMAVPGPVTSKVSEGTNLLIKKKKAELVGSGEEVLAYLGWERAVGDKKKVGVSSKIESLLKNEELSVDDIAMRLKKPVREVVVEISRLQLQGFVSENNGRFYWKE